MQIVSKSLQKRQGPLSVTCGYRRLFLDFSACLLERIFWFIELLSVHDSATMIPAHVRALCSRTRIQYWRVVLPVFGKLSLFKYSDFNINQALICFSAKTTKAGPTIMKKTVVSAGPWSQLSFFLFYYYYMESGLILLFLSSNIWIIFSQKLGCVAAPYRF